MFSGATGQVLRESTGDQGLAERLLAGSDYDLDGVPDVFCGGPRISNDPILYNWIGRIQAISGRDGGVLWDERNEPANPEPGVHNTGDRALGEGLADIGPGPGSPYPVVVVWDWPYRIIGPGPMTQRNSRLRALRVGLPGTAVHGSGCTSSGEPPRIGLRTSPGSLRVTLSGARPNAFAWLLVGPRAATSWQGLALPYSLASWSLPGCDLLVPPDLIFSRLTGTTGWNSGYAVVQAPYTVAAVGLGIAAQWFSFDPTTLDYSMSPRHEFSIQ